MRAAEPAAVRARSTFRRRLATAMAVLALALLALSAAAVYVGARGVLYASLDEALLSIAQSELASATDGPGGRVHVHEEPPVPLWLVGAHGYEKLAQVEDPGGRTVALTANLRGRPVLNPGWALRRRAWSEGIVTGDLVHEGRHYRAVCFRLVDGQGKPHLGVVALSVEPVERHLRLLVLVLAGVLGAGGAGAAFVSHRLARRLTAPLERIAAAARKVQDVDLSVRLPDSAADAELADVTQGLNTMLARLEEGFTFQQRLLEGQRQFTADASHELRTPLTNIRGHLEVALRRPREAEEYRREMQVVLGEVERMGRLVEDLLTLSRADASSLRLDRAPCCLSALAAETAAAFRVAAGRAEVEICLDVPARALVRGDRVRLRQVLDNLVDNALRHAPKGTAVGIVVRARGGVIQLSVVDEGPGLTEAEQEKVFRRFYRADESRARNSGGAGLGLAIARAIAEAHGGTLDVRSRPGVVTAFTLSLPAWEGGADIAGTEPVADGAAPGRAA